MSFLTAVNRPYHKLALSLRPSAQSTSEMGDFGSVLNLRCSPLREPNHIRHCFHMWASYPRHLLTYGRKNRYRPVSRSNASMATADRPSLLLYFPCTTVTPLMMTAAVKTMDTQRWVCRIHLLQFNVERPSIHPASGIVASGTARSSAGNRP